MSVQLSGTARLTPYGKRLIAARMYEKGVSYIKAACLLRRNNGDETIVKQLVCHGAEVVLKSLLLLHDYDKYKPQLNKRNIFCHDVEKIAVEVSKVSRHKLNRRLRDELGLLSEVYKNHFLRYGTVNDVIGDVSTVECTRTYRSIAAVIILTQRLRPFDHPVRGEMPEVP